MRTDTHDMTLPETRPWAYAPVNPTERTSDNHENQFY